jgi:glycosyltransferase involved in cell wall biosynthesis
MPNAVCVIVRNESKYILEWIAHHLVIGFDAVIVLDNESTDRTAEILRSAASRSGNALRYIFWPNRGATTQNDGYHTVCDIYRDEFDWIAFFDADEFLVPVRDRSVRDWLKAHTEAAAIGVNWLFFGSGGHVENPGGLVLEAFQRRGALNFTVDDAGHMPNLSIKSIVRPKRVLGCRNPHAFHVDGIYVDTQGRPLEVEAINGAATLTMPAGAEWRLHHYFVRSRVQWAEKVARGYRDHTYRNISSFFQCDRNELIDSTATVRLPQIRDKIHQIMPYAGDYYDKVIELDAAAVGAAMPPQNDGDDSFLANHWRQFVSGTEGVSLVPAPPALPNVAVGKPARQSSIGEQSLRPDVEQDAAGAVSGRITGEFQFHTDMEDAPWWQVDLEAPHEMVEIRIFNRGGDHALCARLGCFRVECSLDGADWQTVHTHDGSFVIGADGHPMVLRPKAGTIGRLLRIIALQRTTLHLDQVEVYGRRVSIAAAPRPEPALPPKSLPAALDELIALLGQKTAQPGGDPRRSAAP